MSARERQALRHGGLEGQGVSGNLQGLFQAVLKRLAVIFALVPHPGREGGRRKGRAPGGSWLPGGRVIPPVLWRDSRHHQQGDTPPQGDLREGAQNQVQV